ncbi:MAG: beta-N-acetylhexosaminidase [Candidatus Nitrohelix vancouverensis]|uniref:beta-N-acetylhexosaminidase n=1 Tax=Candidatus Nitrohelix vancouverensis TaxID=2705534 RepID=A0A7T0C5B2_9BACT|nr:MAG: beta-N-acetylhexosaminidase [Candidatus Nitrohelix vancouverensis]
MLIIGFEGTSLNREIEEWIVDRKIGGLILFERNYENPAQLHALTNAIQNLARSSGAADVLISVDQEGGRVSRLGAPFTAFPSPCCLGAARSEPLARRFGAALATELLATGVNMVYAPVLDVNSNPDNPIIGKRAFSDSPEWAGRLATAFAAGVREAGVVPVGKHFPGHGDTDRDSHLELPGVDRPADSLEQVELPPFAMAIRDGLEAIMPAHVTYSAWDASGPATFSSYILQDILRGQLGFEGVVISDDLEMKAIEDHYSSELVPEYGVAAGIDQFLICHNPDKIRLFQEKLAEGMDKGRIDMGRVNRSVERIMKLRRSLKPSPAEAPRFEELTEAHRAVAEEMQSHLS